MGRSGHVEMMRGVEELARKKIRFLRSGHGA